MKVCCPYQRGGAIRGFAGPEWQVGGKFSFGRFIWRHARPLLKFLGKQAVRSGAEVGYDLLDGQPIKESIKTRGEQAVKRIVNKAKRKKEEDEVPLLDEQEGSGMARRRRRRIVRKSPRKSIKRVRRSRRSSVKKRRPNVKHLADIFDRR